MLPLRGDEHGVDHSWLAGGCWCSHLRLCNRILQTTAGPDGSNIGINLGVPVYATPSIPVYVPAPVTVPPPPPVVLDGPPQFIIPQDLGFRVAVGVPYDLAPWSFAAGWPM